MMDLPCNIAAIEFDHRLCNLVVFAFMNLLNTNLIIFALLTISGPNLNGLFGRQSGTTPGYSYSAANKAMAVNWEEKTLYDYLLNPKKVLILILFNQHFQQNKRH